MLCIPDRRNFFKKTPPGVTILAFGITNTTREEHILVKMPRILKSEELFGEKIMTDQSVISE